MGSCKFVVRWNNENGNKHRALNQAGLPKACCSMTFSLSGMGSFLVNVVLKFFHQRPLLVRGSLGGDLSRFVGVDDWVTKSRTAFSYATLVRCPCSVRSCVESDRQSPADLGDMRLENLAVCDRQ